MGIFTATAFNALRVGWRVTDIVKPVHTIDELTRLVIDLWNRGNAPSADPEQDVRYQLAALRSARHALTTTGGNEQALGMVKEQISVLGSLLSTAPSTPDPLSGSALIAPTPAPGISTLTPVGSHRPVGRGTIRFLLAATHAGTTPGERWAAAARARMQGQREALDLISHATSGQDPASGVDAVVGTRLAALKSTALVLARPALARPALARPGRARPEFAAPQRPSAAAQRSAAEGTRKRIDIAVGKDQRQ